METALRKPSSAAVTTPAVTPVAPFQLQTTSVMSQDIVSTAYVTLDSEAIAAVAPFINPQADGLVGNPQLEALVVAAPGQGGATTSTLCHLLRDSGTDGGWTLAPLFGGRTVSGVAAGTAYASSASAAVYAVFQDATAVWWTQLDPTDASWSPPAQVLAGALANLRTTYGPSGALVVYGADTGGDLVCAYQSEIGGAFTATTFQTGGALLGAQFSLCMTDDAGGWNALAVVQGALTELTGTLTEAAVTTSQPSVAGSYAGVALGYWSSAAAAIVYLLVGSAGALSIWSGAGSSTQSVPIAIPNGVVTSATGVVRGSPSAPLLDVYSIDDDGGLWVLHQDPDQPWNEDGTPNFAPVIPLDVGIAGVLADPNPVDAATLFAWDGDYGLRLHAQDPITSMWSSGPVQQSSTQTFPIVRFRTEVTLLDANAVPVPAYPVTLQVASGYSAAQVSVAGQLVSVSSEAPVTLATDTNGKLTLAVMTTAGMVAPNLIFAADQLPQQTLSPASPVHSYLSGQGTLNPTNPGGPLPVFDDGGATLTQAQTSDGPLCPALQTSADPPAGLATTAAGNIRSVAQLALGTGGDVAGWAGSLDRRRPRFEILRTREAVGARLAARGGVTASLLGDFEQWAGDVWQGIKNGVITIGDYVVDAANSVAQFFVTVGQDIAGWVSLAIVGLEQAASFVAGVFQALEADVDDVISWLQALFDFGAIWRTQQALQTALAGAPAYLQTFVTFARNATDGWFSQQVAAVGAYFTTLQGQYGAAAMMSGLPGWQPPGQPPSTTPAAGGASPADFGNNVHHNWVQDKFQSYAPATPTLPPTRSQSSLTTLLSSVQPGGAAAQAVQDFQAAFADFQAAMGTAITNPGSFSTVGVSDFLGAAANLVKALLELCDATIDGLLDFAAAALDDLAAVLGAPLDLGLFNAIWSWIAGQGGASPVPAPTMGGVLALLGAFPTTILYKLALGVDSEPFPPQSAGSARTAIFNSLGVQCQEAGSILQAVYALPAVVGDVWGASAPMWLALIKVAWCLADFFLIHGTPDLTKLEWGVGGTTAVLVAALAGYTVKGLLNFAVAISSQSAVDNLVNDALCVLFTVYGAGMLVVGIVLDCTDSTTTPTVAAARFLLPLPSLFALFSTVELREWVAVQLVADLVGYIGGGIAEYLEYEPPSNAALAHAAGVLA